MHKELEVWLNIIYNLVAKEGGKMQIVPMRDLKNTVEIERLCDETNEPVFVTKNGYGRLVVMNLECYERTLKQMVEASQVNEGISDYESERIVKGESAIKKLRKKHDI